MFLISFSQSNATLDWSQVLVDAAAARPWMTSAEVSALSSHAGQVSDLVQRLRLMKLDVTEYTCLKALVLFRPGNRNIQDLQVLQTHTYDADEKHCASSTSTG